MSEQTRRATRLLELERLLRKHPGGLTTAELAQKVGSSPRTVLRDLAVLDTELRVPVEKVGRRWRIIAGADPLAPLHLTLQEARALLFAARLLLRYADEQDPDAVTLLRKLAEILGPHGPIAAYVHRTADALEARPVVRERVEVLRALTEAWAQSRRVHLRYFSLARGEERQTVLDPYLLEPTSSGAAGYVVGHSHEHGQLRTFKVDRIREARVLQERFRPKDLDHLLARMSRSWTGVVLREEEVRVVIDFAPEAAPRVRETHWHPSQRLTTLPDGGVRLELYLPALMEFVPWVRSWGHLAVVREPEELRREVAESFRRAAAQYEGEIPLPDSVAGGV